MAALADLNDYKKRLNAPRETIPISKTAQSNTLGRLFDEFLRGNLQGVAPTVPEVPARTIAGAMGQENAAAEELYCLGAHLGGDAGTFILCDRLSQQGGLSGTVAGVVTTNLPTAALTRYTTTGRVSPLQQFGGTNFNTAGRLIPIPLMAGDTGIRAITDSTLAASTLTAGNFGYVLYKPLVAFSIREGYSFANFSILDGGMSGGIPPILDDACLFWAILPGTISGAIYGTIPFTAV
jgi:hypothetical protein